MKASAQQQPARYAVLFRASGRLAAGALVAAEERLLLEGRDAEGRIELSIPYTELKEVRIGRGRGERMNGRAALLLTCARGEQVQIEPYSPGLLHELGDLLAGLTADHSESDDRVAVIVPLKSGCLARARELVAQGPPFDPAELDLVRHQVFLTPRQAIFLFEGPDIRKTLERASRDPALWAVGLAWRACIGGRPRLVALPDPRVATHGPPVYSWTAGAETA